MVEVAEVVANHPVKGDWQEEEKMIYLETLMIRRLKPIGNRSAPLTETPATSLKRFDRVDSRNPNPGFVVLLSRIYREDSEDSTCSTCSL